MSRRVAIAGVGYSQVGRNTGLSERHHAAQAALAALADAGMEMSEVKGMSTWGGDAVDFGHFLGAEPLDWHLNVGASPAFASPAIHAVMAIEAGLVDTVMAFRIMMQQPSSAAMASGGAGPMMMFSSDMQFSLPFGVMSPTQWAGMMMQRYLHESGATERDFATFASIQREYAALNDDALMRTPMSPDDYLAAPYISSPLRLLDCDYPCDSGSAVIFTTEERARDLQQPVVLVDSYAMASTHDMNFEVQPDMVRTAPHHCAERLWARTELNPADVDCAQLYDGFTFVTFQWLEALGLCEPLEGARFAAAGETRLGGKMPTNTDGGACNVGRRHGANFCIEATRQLRGACGRRQVADAEVAVWANAVGPFAGAMLLTKG